MKKKTVRQFKKSFSIIPAILWVLLCEGAGMLGSLATFPKIAGWYEGLVRPTFSPPNWVFGPVWTLLYFLMGVAAYRIWSLGTNKRDVRTLIPLFLIHLGVNVLWSVVFFGFEQIGGALLVIGVLWAFIAVLTVRFAKLDKTSAYLMIPYLLWVSFASVLNLALLILNT